MSTLGPRSNLCSCLSCIVCTRSWPLWTINPRLAYIWLLNVFNQWEIRVERERAYFFPCTFPTLALYLHRADSTFLFNHNFHWEAPGPSFPFGTRGNGLQLMLVSGASPSLVCFLHLPIGTSMRSFSTNLSIWNESCFLLELWHNIPRQMFLKGIFTFC